MKSYRLVYLGRVGRDVLYLSLPNQGFGPTPRTQGTQPWGAVPAQCDTRVRSRYTCVAPGVPMLL